MMAGAPAKFHVCVQDSAGKEFNQDSFLVQLRAAVAARQRKPVVPSPLPAAEGRSGRELEVARSVLGEVRRRIAPEASASWCNFQEILSAYEDELWAAEPEAHISCGEQYTSLHLGRDAESSIFALAHFLASRERLGHPKKRWCWRGAAADPHFEGGGVLTSEPVEHENVLRCGTSENWFFADDGSGSLVSGSPSVLQVEHFWKWVQGPPSTQLDAPSASTASATAAKRLANLVMASDLVFTFRRKCDSSQRSSVGLAFSALLAAIGALRIGGCFCYSTGLFDEPYFEFFLSIVSMLFGRVELIVPALPNSRRSEVVVMALHFQKLQPGLLHAFTTSVKRVIAGKQQAIVAEEWACGSAASMKGDARVWIEAQNLQRSEWLASFAASRDSAIAEQYISRQGWAPIPEHRHLLWSCGPELLRRDGRVPSICEASGGEDDVEAALEASGRTTAHRRERWEALEGVVPSGQAGKPQKKRRRPPDDLGGDCNGGVGSKRACLEEQVANEGSVATTTKYCTTKEVRWFALNPEILPHRTLLRLLQSHEVALLAARKGSWWCRASIVPPWSFSNSAFASKSKLHALIQARAAAPCIPPQTQCDDLPPTLVTSLVQVVMSALPHRVSNGARSLAYQRGLLLLDASKVAPPGPESDTSAEATWMSSRMGVPMRCAQGLSGQQVAEAVRSGQLEQECRRSLQAFPGEGFDLVVMESCGGVCRHAPWEVAPSELEVGAKHRFLSTVLFALCTVGVGGDLFIQLSSLYTRFFAGIFACLAVAFDRVTLISPDVAPPWKAERWIACASFGTVRSVESRAVQAVLGELLKCIHSFPVGQSVLQSLPPCFLCTLPSGIRQFLRDANDECIDAELSFWSSHDLGQSNVAGDDMKSAGKILRRLTEKGVKHVLFPDVTKSRIGVYFGTFDPIHENHFRMVLHALRHCGVARVMLVPNPDGNQYKPRSAPLWQREAGIKARISAAIEANEIQPAEVEVRLATNGCNWPGREDTARAFELEIDAETTTSVESIFLMGEDSFLKSLRDAGRHKNSGIYQSRSRSRQIIVFPRSGNVESLVSKVPAALPHVRVAQYSDEVQGLSSSLLRGDLNSGEFTSRSRCLHPAVLQELSCRHAHTGEPRRADPDHLSDAEGGTDAADETDPRVHYGRQKLRSLDKRAESAAVRVRNFNSFAKALLLERLLGEARERAGGEGVPLAVLDIGCGRGGDLKKFISGGVVSFCGADISRPSLEEFVGRLPAVVRDAKGAKHGRLAEVGVPLREVSLLHADCWNVRLAPIIDRACHGTANPGSLGEAWFHAVSSQMSCHYAFESESSVHVMLRNVSERLCVGGVFVCTVPDSRRIVRAQQAAFQKSGKLTMGNSLYKVEFEPAQWDRVSSQPECWELPGAEALGRDVFGVEYRFTLMDAVQDCCEPLAHLGVMQHLAEKYGLELHYGPKPLASFVSEALGEDGAPSADAGRLRRIYFYGGGMDCASAEELEVLGLYVCVAFRKTGVANGRVDCRGLSQRLLELYGRDSSEPRFPKCPGDIISIEGV